MEGPCPSACMQCKLQSCSWLLSYRLCMCKHKNVYAPAYAFFMECGYLSSISLKTTYWNHLCIVLNYAFLWTSILFQTCQTPIRPISPSSLLDSICWSISEPTSTASIYTDSFSSEDVSEHQSVFFDANGDGKDSGASFTNLTRSLTERWLITLSLLS